MWGGYTFKKLPEEVSVLYVVEALDGNVAPSAWTSGAPCNQIDHCVVQEVWTDVKTNLEGVLGAANIADLAYKESLMREGMEEMYYI